LEIAAGSRLGPYELLAPVGAGGMREVWRARDTRLNRMVAIKVLPSHLSSNPNLRERFDREARAISGLSHPHICTLYDVGHQDGTDYLVMEYLEGQTLADRLAKGPLPLEQVLTLGIQICEALEKAHRSGIVHRDLKPGNVMLTKSGATLLDFGLARWTHAPVSGATDATAGVDAGDGTVRKSLTAEGTILGTLQYMAPEQLEGREADARSDIFAFGATLYEMATGRRAFSGESRASLIASILTSEPPAISTLQPLTPVELDRIVTVCLSKDPDERFSGAHDVLLALRWIQQRRSVGGRGPLTRRSREWLAWGAAGVLAVAAILLAIPRLGQRASVPPVVRSTIQPPEKSRFEFDNGPITLSPDGQSLAFTAPNADGRTRLWVRPLGQISSQPLAGTEEAANPFWSPDNRFIAFFAHGKLQRIAAAGGTPQTICDAQQGRGGSWGPNDTIIFSPAPGDPIYRVDAAGGRPTPVTAIDMAQGEFSHRWPSFLPDGQHFLYLVQGSRSAESYHIYLGSLDGKTRRVLVAANSNVIYADPGYLLYYKDRALQAQPFDAKSGEFRGDPVLISDMVQYNSAFGCANFSAAAGLLTYAGGATVSNTQLTWFDRLGKRLEVLGGPADYWDPRLSHDGRRIAVVINNPEGDIWIYDISRRVFNRLTFDPVNEYGPVWSPDDRWIVFTSYRNSAGNLYRKLADGGGEAEVLADSPYRKIATDWSHDGRTVLYHELRQKTRWDISMLRLEGAHATPASVVATPVTEFSASLSTDGRWLAYVAEDTGKNEIYVRQFPTGGKWQVSSDGGAMPVWRRDGKELFYLSPAGQMMAVPISTDQEFSAGTPVPLFPVAMRRFGGLTRRQYDVAPDGQRFLVNVAGNEIAPVPLTLVQNWTSAIRK
jgi:eukaryotic-like serine/threonine-protein kinase